MSIRTRFIAVAVVLLMSACNEPHKPAGPAPKPVSEASRHWSEVSQSFIRGYFDNEPFFAAQSGKHEYDGQLPDVSDHGLRRMVAYLHDQRQQIEQIDPAALEPRERFDREYLLSVIDGDLFAYEKSRAPYTNPAFYIGNLDPDMFLSRDYEPLDQRLKAYIKYAQGIPKMTADIQKNLKGPLPKTFVELGVLDFGGFVDFYKKDVGAVFASVSDATLQKQLADADENAAQAMANLRDYMISLRKTANDNFALGKDLFAQMLKDSERVELPLEQIEAAGRADLERNTAALKEECAKLLPKGPITACIAKVTSKKPPQGPVEAARQQLTELRKFVVEHDIVSIPNNDPVHVAEAPPYNRSNAAFIQVPGPYDHGVASTYNIAPPDPKWSKAEQAAYIPSQATLLFTSVHEVWPGHFLQFLHANSDPDTLEAIWVSYGYAEGWAHYCEEMMWEEGLGNGDPETHIGQLIDALLRDVRLLSAIGLHTGQMTVAQSEKMFREQAYQDPGNARQQAARGTYDPAYLNYTLNKLMIRKLRADWVAQHRAAGSADPKASWKAFHDEFLSYGGPPVPLLRKQMLGATSAEAGALL